VEPNSVSQQITVWLTEWRQGDERARDRLFEVVHPQLRQLASRFLHHERHDHTLEPNALVNELCVRLLGAEPITYEARTHFFAIAAQAMRRILIERARSRRATKRGSGTQKVSLEEVADISNERAADLIALDEALTNLALIDPRKAQIVELKYFGGMTIEEAAEVLEVSTPTVERDWKMAKIWLHREISKTS